MFEKYILYSVSDPFAGYIVNWGKIDLAQPRDGSTMIESIETRLAERPDLRLFKYPLGGPTITEEVRETKKFRPSDNSLVSLDPGDMTLKAKAAATEAAKVQSLVDNLPSWAAVSSAVDGISNLAEAKVFLKKLARVVYWLAKNSEV